MLLYSQLRKANTLSSCASLPVLQSIHWSRATMLARLAKASCRLAHCSGGPSPARRSLLSVSNAVSIARRDKVKLLAVSAIGYHRQHILLSAFLTSQQSVRNISRPVASMRSRKGEVEEPNGQFGILQHLFDKQSCSTGIASRPFRCALVQLVDRYARC